MKLSFAELEYSIPIDSGYISTLEVQNSVLFTRICQSLFTRKGEDSVEPYAIWNADNQRIDSTVKFLHIFNPFDLPWKHKSLLAALYQTFENRIFENEYIRGKLEDLHLQINSCILSVGLQFEGKYDFELEWNICSYLKSMSFGIAVEDTVPLLDNLIAFLEYAADVGLQDVIVFYNIKNFLSEKELIEFSDSVFFHKIKVLLLENQKRNELLPNERKLTIDQVFLEIYECCGSECTFSSQGEICANGFGAVTF